MNSRQFLMLIGITFFVGMVWLISDIIFNTKASIPISPKLQSALEPLTPTFNSRVLDVIDKETFDSSEIESFQTVETAEPEVQAKPSPSTKSVSSPLPSASPSPSSRQVANDESSSSANLNP